MFDTWFLIRIALGLLLVIIIAFSAFCFFIIRTIHSLERDRNRDYSKWVPFHKTKKIKPKINDEAAAYLKELRTHNIERGIK